MGVALNKKGHIFLLNRGNYPLLEFTPDPLGDWVAGRFDRLVRAELNEIGLARVRP